MTTVMEGEDMTVVIDMIGEIDTIGMAGAKSDTKKNNHKKAGTNQIRICAVGIPHKGSWVSTGNI
jgi:hypothetical protein